MVYTLSEFELFELFCIMYSLKRIRKVYITEECGYEINITRTL